MYKTVFVILHYINIDDTIKCVESIKKYASNSNIVIVDNASSNNSGNQLIKMFSIKDGIYVILNKENLGFGYSYAKENLNPDFIMCINNDILIKDGDFLDQVYNIFEETSFDILGPDIFNPFTNSHQSPIRSGFMNKKDVAITFKNITKTRWIIEIKRLLSFLHLRVYKNNKAIVQDVKLNKSKEAVIHGSFVIYSKYFIANESFAFVPITFMYYEEDLLKLYCMKKNYKMLFDPSIQIYHLEGKSTSSSLKSNYKKDLFRLKHSKDSLKIYNKMLTKEFNTHDYN